ncbi:MAG: response regulator transcription factor [Syntrophobacteraceae bacterium]|nr:response regulator transcription factor [Syntrophobacteraceae bacterium]
MIKVLLADDHDIVRAGLRRIVEESGEIAVIAEASDGRQVLGKVKDECPDVVVVDISMPLLDGFEVISQLHSQHPQVPVLVLSMHEEEQYVVRAIGLGAKGYMSKRSAPEQLVSAIRKLYAGGFYLSESAAESVAFRLARGNREKSQLDTLSNREVQVLRLLAMGQSVREIAESYSISAKTVNTYRFRLMQKLSIRNITELTRFAIRNKLIDL